jgi:hypothetical protein
MFVVVYIFDCHFQVHILFRHCWAIVVFENSVLETEDLVDGLSGRVVNLGLFGGLGDAHALEVD